MAKKSATVNMFYADELAVDTLPSASAETIKKGKYRVFNGNDYDIVYLQTSADQVLESDSKQFVSKTEKNTWNNKSDKNHHHDDVYAKISNSYTQEQIRSLLDQKANITHKHYAYEITDDSTHRFVTDSDKTKWDDTYSTSEINSKIGTVNDAVQALDRKNDSAHSTITQAYKDADKLIDARVTTVQSKLDEAVENLKGLIDSGGAANTELTAKVENIENVIIPGVKQKVDSLDSKVTGAIKNLQDSKADKTKVEADILAAKHELQLDINTKANQNYVDNKLSLKADATNVFTKEEVTSSLSSKAEKSYVDTGLDRKVDKTTFTSELQKKADDAATKAALATKASTQSLESGLALKSNLDHTHTPSQVKGLGTVATRDIGTGDGNIPVLDAKGKLNSSVLPAIAINEIVTANTQTEAMQKDMQIGDILVLTNVARDVAIEKQKQGEAVTYQIAKAKSYQELSDEYITYIADGQMTYLCVNDKAKLFEDKFKPLQSSGDTISKAEVDSKLASKVSDTTFNAYKQEVSDKLDLKANQATTYTKTDVDQKLSKKVNVESGKQLSANDFTDILKNKLDHIAENANNYTHPTGDGHYHVPATGTSNSGKFLMAVSSASSPSWVRPTTEQISETDNRKFVTSTQITEWTGKAERNHNHTEYRLKNDSFTKDETIAEINKMQTIISTTQPSPGTQMVGAVWIQEIK